jgi:multisubunit Na+/H+ antiporter MnhG subunit
MIGIIGAAWLLIGVGIWMWSSTSFEDHAQAVSVLPIIVLAWPVLAIAIVVTYVGSLILDRWHT